MRLKFEEGQSIACAECMKYRTIGWLFESLRLPVKKIENHACDRVDSTSCVS